MKLWDQQGAWYAVQVKPKRERPVAMLLRLKGYEEFLPTMGGAAQSEKRKVACAPPLFPGYVFCRFDPSVGSPIVTTPGVIGILGSGRSPIPIDQKEMDSIRRIAAANVDAHPYPAWPSPGTRVTIRNGPLRGVEGVCERTQSDTRLIVSVTLLQRSVAVEIERSWI